MSIVQSSYFSPSIQLPSPTNSLKIPRISFSRYGKSKVPLSCNDQKSPCISGETGFLFDDFPCFPSPRHPLEAELPGLQDDEPCCDEEGGIGIVKFFEGKNIFITGGTGLVGKVFMEKLLRSTSVGKIYVLIKADDKQAAMDRLQNDIISSELFEVLGINHGDHYEVFVKEKLIPVVGNICELNLGMDFESAQAIMNNVDVIVGSAASTTLNDRYDVLLDINVSATQRLMRFAKTCKNLKLFVHFSTAYVNGRKEGLIFEKPLVMGETGTHEAEGICLSSFPQLDLAHEMSLATKACTSSSNVTKDLKRLGQERANYLGWYTAYHMTKAMSEMVLDEIRGDTPVLIIRPSVIESSFKEPFPGWIQGNRMFDPFIISHGKGHLPAFLADPHAHMDIIPVDMVVNSTIAAIAKHGMMHKPQLNVYHVASGVANPLRFGEFFEIIHEYFKSTSSFMANDIKKVEFFNNVEVFSKYTRDEIVRLHNNGAENAIDVNGKISDKKCRVKIAYAEQLCKMYEFLGFFKGRFHTGNTMKLLSEMSKKEQDEFEIDANKIDWTKYFMDAHIPGLKKHVMT